MTQALFVYKYKNDRSLGPAGGGGDPVRLYERGVRRMLQLKDVSITYKKDLRVLISQLSLVLNPGDKAALIGEEGNGKSTLMKLIYDEGMVEDYIEFSGDIIRNGSVQGYLKQELDSGDKEMSVYEFMEQEPAFYDMDAKELAGLAGKLGLSVEMLYSDQRVEIGRASCRERV